MKKSNLSTFIIMALLIVVMGVVLFFVSQQGKGGIFDLRNRAAFAGINLSMTPSTTKYKVGTKFSIAINAGTRTLKMSQIVMHLSYDPEAIEITRFATGSALPIPIGPPEIKSNEVVATVKAKDVPGYYNKASGRVGTLFVTVKSAKKSTITFTTDTYISVVGQPINYAGTLTGLGINVAGQPTPTPAPKNGIVISDNFSGVRVNTALWYQNNRNITVANGKATIVQPLTAKKRLHNFLRLNTPIKGNFTAEVTIAPNPGSSGSEAVQMRFQSADAGSGFLLGPDGLHPNETPIVNFNSWKPAPAAPRNLKTLFVPQGTPSYRLRMVRVGTTVSGYVDYGTGFQLVGTQEKVYKGNGYIFLIVFNDAKFPPLPLSTSSVSGDYSNFIVTYAQVPPPPDVTPTPTPPTTGNEQDVKFQVKLDGVTKDTPNLGELDPSMRVTLTDQAGNNIDLGSITLSSQGEGVFSGSGTISAPFAAGTKYTVRVKGEKHLAVRFRQQTGQTAACADATQFMTMPAHSSDAIVYDFTGVPLPAGDTGNDTTAQDGIVNQTDIDNVTSLEDVASKDLTDQEKLQGDLNYDGTINGFDLFAIYKTLSYKCDAN